ncbi:uncharacterized protein LOC124460488 [Drosophila willistoni]|uniref:uncharacterized protein LOC124460488 n=1 Tax=Drosophila willistoni TaxID=7260 RepID=UPI001F079E98|nr:uncharacterized protein LOC124460488 [Drosophila willistoni]
MAVFCLNKKFFKLNIKYSKIMQIWIYLALLMAIVINGKCKANKTAINRMDVGMQISENPVNLTEANYTQDIRNEPKKNNNQGLKPLLFYMQAKVSQLRDKFRTSNNMHHSTNESFYNNIKIPNLSFKEKIIQWANKRRLAALKLRKYQYDLKDVVANMTYMNSNATEIFDPFFAFHIQYQNYQAIAPLPYLGAMGEPFEAIIKTLYINELAYNSTPINQ